MPDPIQCLKYKGFGESVSVGSLVLGVPTTELELHGCNQLTLALEVTGVVTSATVRVESQIDVDNDVWFNQFDQDRIITANGGHKIVIDCTGIRRARIILMDAQGGTPTIAVKFLAV